jgi:hypothetical protein
MMVHVSNPNTLEAKTGDHEFKASLGHIVRDDMIHEI